MAMTYVTHFLAAILVIVGAVLPIVNPPGDAPLFLRLTSGCDDATRKLLATRIAGYSLMLLLGSMLFGSFVLRLFDLSIAVVQVTGGRCGMRPRLEAAERRSEAGRNGDRPPPGLGRRARALVLSLDDAANH
jgi:multiple antibiotic resistance protein